MSSRSPLRVSKRTGFYLILLVTCLIIIFPIYWMNITAVKSFREIFASPPTFFPQAFDSSEFQTAFKGGRAFVWLANTLIVALGTVALTLVCATPAAYALAKSRFRGRYVTLFLVLSTQMVPSPLIIVPLFTLFREYNLINTFLAVILADTILTLPLSTWILMGFFEKIPRELAEAALVDGCNRYSVFFRIALPMTLPILLVVGVITFFDSWNEYIFAATFLTEQENWVYSVGLASFRGQFHVDWREMMSYSILGAFPPIIFYLIFRKKIVTGLVTGFLK